MLATLENPFICSFREKDFGHYFETFKASENVFGMPHIIDTEKGHQRYAHVKETVAHVVVDEDEYGKAVIEVWKIRKI